MKNRVLWLAMVLATPVAAEAWRFTLLLETDVDRPSGEEVFHISYTSMADFLATNIAADGYSIIDIASTWSIGGFAYDGDRYHLILETNDDQSGGQEVYRVTFNSMSDFLSSNPVAFGYSQIDISSGWSIGGFASDGDQYHLILESDLWAPAGEQVYRLTYNSMSDFIDNNIAVSGYSEIFINPAWSIGGFASDGDLYHLIFELDVDPGAGHEVYRYTYNSMIDLIENNVAAEGYSSIDMGSSWSIGGFSGAIPLFADGFESGDTSYWSSTNP